MSSTNRDYREQYILHTGDTITSGNTVYTITNELVAYGGSAVIYSSVASESSRKSPIKYIIKEVFPNEDLFERQSGIIRPRDPDNAGELKFHRDHIAEEQILGGLCYNGTNLAVSIRHVIHPDKITIEGKEYTEDIQDGVFAVLDDISGKAISFKQMLECIKQPKNENYPLRNGGCPTLHTTACLIEQVLLTLQAIHNQNILFGDIHMDNIWFGDCRLDLGIIRMALFMDFGCSRRLVDGKKTDVIGGRIFSSEGFIPPELLPERWAQGDGTISIQADIFSVGCLMLRCLFPDEYWDHFGKSPSIGSRTIQRDDAKRLGIDNSLRRKVNDILAQAMHPDPEERYPSADAMLKAIQELKRDTEPPKYLLPKAPGSSESFVEGSRTAEIDNVTRRLAINKPTFLWGCGGIGKSEISIKVAEEFEKCSPKGAYFVHYTVPSSMDQEAMEETVLRMPFSGYKYEPKQGMSLEEQRKAEYKDRIHILREHYAGALLVIDNFDWPGKTWEDLTAEKSYLEMEAIGLNLLFTTRSEVPGMPEVKELSREDLLSLMRRWCTDYNTITDQQLYSLIDGVDGHTLTVDLIAKCLSRSRRKVTPEMMLECLQNHKLSEVKYPVTHRVLVKGENPERIGHRDPKTTQIYEHLKALFDLSGLDEQMKTILCYATLLPEGGMDCQLFESCLEESQEQPFEYLLYCGWLRNSNDNVLSIHPIIREVCRGELKPDKGRCAHFINTLIANSTSTYAEKQITQQANVLEEAVIYLQEYEPSWLFSVAHMYRRLGNEMKQFYALNTICRDLASIDNNDNALECYVFESIADVYEKLENKQKRKEYLLKAIDSCLAYSNQDKLFLASLYVKLSNAYHMLGDEEGRQDSANKALQIYGQLCGEDVSDKQCSTIMTNLGMLYCDVNNFTRMYEWFDKALRVKLEVFPADHPELAELYYYLGFALMKLKKYQEASVSVEKAIAIWEPILPQSHPDLSKAYDIMVTIHENLNHRDLAMQFVIKSIASIKKHADQYLHEYQPNRENPDRHSESN